MQAFSKYSMPVLLVDAHLTVVDAAVKGYFLWDKIGEGSDAQTIVKQTQRSYCSFVKRKLTRVSGASSERVGSYLAKLVRISTTHQHQGQPLQWYNIQSLTIPKGPRSSASAEYADCHDYNQDFGHSAELCNNGFRLLPEFEDSG